MSKREQDIPPVDHLFIRQDATRVGRDSRDLGDLPREGWREIVNKYLPEHLKGIIPSSEEADRQKEVTDIMLSRGLSKEEAVKFLEGGADLGGLPASEPSLFERVVPEEIRRHFRPSTTTKESTAAKAGSVAMMVSGVEEPFSMMDPSPLFHAANPLFKIKANLLKTTHIKGPNVTMKGSEWIKVLTEGIEEAELTNINVLNNLAKKAPEEEEVSVHFLKGYLGITNKSIDESKSIYDSVNTYLNTIDEDFSMPVAWWTFNIPNNLSQNISEPILKKLEKDFGNLMGELSGEQIFDIFEDVFPGVNNIKPPSAIDDVFEQIPFDAFKNAPNTPTDKAILAGWIPYGSGNKWVKGDWKIFKTHGEFDIFNANKLLGTAETFDDAVILADAAKVSNISPPSKISGVEWYSETTGGKKAWSYGPWQIREDSDGLFGLYLNYSKVGTSHSSFEAADAYVASAITKGVVKAPDDTVGKVWAGFERTSDVTWKGVDEFKSFSIFRESGRNYQILKDGYLVETATTWAEAQRQVEQVLSKVPDLPLLDEFKRVGPQQGSNPGGWYEHNGSTVYAKFYDDPNQAAGEALANRIYNTYGRQQPAPSSYLFMHEGKLVFASHEATGFKNITSIDDITPAQAKDFLEHSPLDILLSNWDVIGLEADNIMVRGNRVKRVDQGGALLHRAQGGKKTVEDLAILSEFDRLPKKPFYKALLEKAGYKDFYDLTPEFSRIVDELPYNWSGDVEGYSDFPGVSKDEIAKIARTLERRSRLLKEKVREMVPVYFNRLISDQPGNLPEWQKVINIDFEKNPAARHLFRDKYKYALQEKYPEFKAMLDPLSTWFTSSKRTKSSMSDILNFKKSKYITPEYQPTESHRQGVKEIIRSIARSPSSAPAIYRGKYLYSNELKKLNKLKVGDDYHILPSSFTTDVSVARSFTTGEGLIIKVLPESKAFNVAALSHHHEWEWIAGGSYKVVGKRRVKSEGVWFHELTIKQTGVFNVK